MLLAAAIMSNATYAQKKPADKVPATVASAFKARFPNTTKVTWEKESEKEFEATFKLNGEKTSINFDNSGKWLETETELKISALPAAVQSTISKEFAGFKADEASKVESAKDGICYEAELEKGKEEWEVLFSADGKVLSKTKEEEKGK